MPQKSDVGDFSSAEQMKGMGKGMDVKIDPSPTVRDAFESLASLGKEADAATFAGRILKEHSDYVGGKAASLKLTPTPRRQPASEWLAEVQGLFDWSRIRELGKSERSPVLHGRLMIVGLCLLEPGLYAQLQRDGVFDGLAHEIDEPFEQILTEHGRTLLESLTRVPFDSVPNQPDDPLKSIDEDQLGRAAFARYLVRRIATVSPDSGAYSLHIHGPWGSGKTTLLNFMRGELEQDKKWLVAEFNAWRHQHIRPPWWSMIDSISRQMKRELSPWVRARDWWWRFSMGRLHYIAGLIVLAWVLALFILPSLRTSAIAANRLVAWATVADSVGKILATIVTIWGIVFGLSRSLLLGSAKAAKSYMELTHDPMNEIKTRFEWCIRCGTKKRVAVFIDDLDRCQSRYVVELLEGIQTLFREAPVVFVVAADRQWLNACYEQVYRELEPSICEPGKRLGTLFLEKVFQSSTPVPGVPKTLKEAYWLNLLQITRPAMAEELRKARKEAGDRLASAGTEDRMLHLVGGSRRGTFAEQQAIREEAVVRLATPELIERMEHTLTPFAGLLDTNPRAMKRFVNAYSVNRALAMLAYVDIERDQLALWTILSMRWPQLAESLEKNPAMIEDIKQQNVAGFPEDLKKLCSDREVVAVATGGSVGTGLDETIVAQCALQHG